MRTHGCLGARIQRLEIRAGGSIEVLSCTDASDCTPVSAPLALGDTFDADFPLVASDIAAPIYVSSDGYLLEMDD